MSDFRCQACGNVVNTHDCNGLNAFTIYQSARVYKRLESKRHRENDLGRVNTTRYLCQICTIKLNTFMGGGDFV